jgi:hypothetical protein
MGTIKIGGYRHYKGMASRSKQQYIQGTAEQ